MRTLTDEERVFLRFVLAQPLAGSAEFLSQVPFTTGDHRDECGCPSLKLVVDAARAAPAAVDGRVHFEARAKTPKGYPIDVIVHHAEGYLRELEFIGYTDPDRHFAIPPVQKTELFGWDESDPAGFPFTSKLT